jgi:hypothetical protein
VLNDGLFYATIVFFIGGVMIVHHSRSNVSLRKAIPDFDEGKEAYIKQDSVTFPFITSVTQL